MNARAPTTMTSLGRKKFPKWDADSEGPVKRITACASWRWLRSSNGGVCRRRRAASLRPRSQPPQRRPYKFPILLHRQDNDGENDKEPCPARLHAGVARGLAPAFGRGDNDDDDDDKGLRLPLHARTPGAPFRSYFWFCFCLCLYLCLCLSSRRH
jgi:hypothetical protein